MIALVSCAGCHNSNAPPPLVLGSVANTGGINRAGKHAEQGITLALKQAVDNNLEGSLADRRLQVRFTDSRGQLDALSSEAARLTDVNRVVGLIGGTTPDEVARLDRGKIPLLAYAGVRPPGVSEMVFALGMRPTQQGTILAKYIADDTSFREIIVFTDERREDFLTVADAFARQFAEARKGHGKPAVTVPVRFGKDAKWDELAALITQRRTLSAVFFAGSARDWLELRRKQTAPLPLIFAGDDGDSVGLDPAGKEPIYVATAFARDKDAPRQQAFIQKYREAFKEEPDVAAALGYEALELYADALKRISPTFSAEKLQAALREVKDFPGLAGPLTMTSDQYLQRVLYVARIDGTGLTMLRRHDPGTLP
jgi:branched-chain amino acid transport system substrate-binding protein